MTKSRSKKPQKRPTGYHHRRVRRQTGVQHRRDGTEWAWAELLWRGVTSAWLAFWRWVWGIHLRLAIFLTLLVVGYWVGLLRVLPYELFVPLRAGIFLYWVLAGTCWVFYRLAKRQQARDLQIGDMMNSYYAVELGGDFVGSFDVDSDGGGFDWVDLDFDFDVGGD